MNTNDNGTNEVSILSKIRTEHKKDADGATVKKLVEAWKAANKATAAKQIELDAAKEKESDAVLALAKAIGAKSPRIDGQVYDFACRGTLVFFRKKSADVVDL